MTLMTKIYILEVLMLAIIIDIFGIILRRTKKNDEKNYTKKRRLDYPLIILFAIRQIKMFLVHLVK